MLHGGIILTMFDETLAYATLYQVGPAVTAEIQARLRRPAPLDQTYTLTGQVVKSRLGLVQARAAIVDPFGNLVAEADGKCMLMKEPGIG